MADLKHLSDQILQLSVREAIQLGAHLLAGAGISLSGGVSSDCNDVVLLSFGANKINAIKVVRELTSLGLKDAKDLVEAAPQTVLKGVTREIADNARLKLIEIGATVDVRPA